MLNSDYCVDFVGFVYIYFWVIILCVYFKIDIFDVDT